MVAVVVVIAVAADSVIVAMLAKNKRKSHRITYIRTHINEVNIRWTFDGKHLLGFVAVASDGFSVLDASMDSFALDGTVDECSADAMVHLMKDDDAQYFAYELHTNLLHHFHAPSL